MNAERIALVTGSNRGIGLEAAKQLARRGFHTVMASRDEEKGERAAEEIRSHGGKATALALDVSSSESIRSAVRQFGSIADRLDVLINNAGVYPDEGFNILTLPRERLSQTFQTNTFGALEVTQAFLPYLRKSESARVINVSSGYGRLEGLWAGEPSYSLSKLALNGLSIMLADALRQDHIAVNSMSPGWVRTAMGGPGASLSVEEGADTVVWLADEAPHDLTGKFFRNRTEISW